LVSIFRTALSSKELRVGCRVIFIYDLFNDADLVLADTATCAI
jgi:hypothetical protein